MKRCKPAAERKLNLVRELIFYPLGIRIDVHVIPLAFPYLYFLGLQQRSKRKVRPLSKLQPEKVRLISFALIDARALRDLILEPV